MDKEQTNVIKTFLDSTTVNWYCSGCDSLCTLLCDRRVNPNRDLAECKRGIPKWRDEDEINKSMEK